MGGMGREVLGMDVVQGDVTPLIKGNACEGLR